MVHFVVCGNMAVTNLCAPLCILLAALLLPSRLSDQHHVITIAVIGPGIASSPDKLCSIWCFTQDVRLGRFYLPPNHRYGLQDNPNNLYVVISALLLSGDISDNPGPERARSGARPILSVGSKGQCRSVTCLVINAQSLKSINKADGKKVCNLFCFQELVQSEQADVVWATETWLTSFVENKEILPSGYAIYRRDRGSRAGGVLLAVKANSFSSCREIADLNDSDLETVSVELTTKSKAKILACCCYRTPTPEKDWSDKLNIYLAKCSSRYGNMLIAGDFNLPEIHWESPERSKGVDEVAFVEQLSVFF